MRSGAASSGFLIRLLYDEYGRACVAERFFALFVIAQILGNYADAVALTL